MLQKNTLEQRKYKGVEILNAIVLNPGNACVLVTISRGGLLFKFIKSGGMARKMVIGYHHY